MEKIRKRFGYHNGLEEKTIGTRGGLSLFWRDDVKVSLVSNSYWHIDVEIEVEETGKNWYLTGFYGNPVEAQGRELWRLPNRIKVKHKNPIPWLVMGDFNEILLTREKKGGCIRNEQQMVAFREALDACELDDLGFSGPWYTWERGRLANNNIRERLDRMVATSDWWTIFPDSKIRHLPFFNSDHRPILMNTIGNRMCERDEEGSRQFRIEATWVTEDTCEAEIRRLWADSTGSVPEKLEKLGTGLNEWSRRISHDKKARQKFLEEELE